jgi:hypothetical protein
MFTKRYSQAEMEQWHMACSDAAVSAHDAPRQSSARAATAKGQGERTSATADAESMSAAQAQTSDDWAGECLFDWYNGQ